MLMRVFYLIKMMRLLQKTGIAVLFFFIFLQPLFADKVLLKNGNTLEGKIIQEEGNALWLEMRIGKGSGRTKISKATIKSIEASPDILETSPVPIKAPVISAQTGQSPQVPMHGIPKEKKKALYLLLGVFLFIFILPPIFLSKIIKAYLERPLGIKIISFWLNYCAVGYLLAGLMLVSLAGNDILFSFKGIDFFVFLFLAIGIPLFLFIVFAGFFYLREWARITVTILFVAGILGIGAQGLFKKDFPAHYLQSFWQKAQKELPLENINLASGGQFLKEHIKIPDAELKWGSMVFLFLLILYLSRRKIQEAFLEASQQRLSNSIHWARLFLGLIFILVAGFFVDRLYQYACISLSGDPNLFVHPKSSKGVIVKDPALLKEFRSHQALGYHFFLPNGMQELKQSDTSVVFADRLRGRSCILTKEPALYYQAVTRAYYAQWNPMLLILRSISRFGTGRHMVLQEIEFTRYKGIFSIYIDDARALTLFMVDLKDVHDYDNALECTFIGKTEDSFMESENIASILAFIE